MQLNSTHLNSASSLNPAVRPTGLRNQYMSLTTFQDLPLHQQKNLLGVIAFNAGEPIKSLVPLLQVPAQVISDGHPAQDASCEAWFGEGNGGDLHSISVELADGGELRYRHDGDYLFGTITLNEPIGLEDSSGAPLQQVSELAYQQIFSLLDTLDYQHVYRFWNYIANINGTSHGQERYRQFNIGRQDAFLASQRALTSQLPAACALGIPEGPLTIAFLAGRRPARAVENPRQVSAYEYPEVYGPRSPSFSRATLLQGLSGEEDPAQDVLFISGTASIVGHETLHKGDVLAQVRETLANLEALIGEARTHQHREGYLFDTQNALYRVYLRNSEDIAIVKKEITRVFGDHANTVFLQADVCRDDLLLEIEATLFSTPSSHLNPQVSR